MPSESPERSGARARLRSRLEGHPAIEGHASEVSAKAGSAALVGLSVKADRQIAGGFVNDFRFQFGHLLRDRASPFRPLEERKNTPWSLWVEGSRASSAFGVAVEQNVDSRTSLFSRWTSSTGGNSRWGENESHRARRTWAAYIMFRCPDREATLHVHANCL